VDERVATPPKLTGRKKAAILLVSLGKEGAAEVFKHLSNDMIEQLTVEMAKTSAVEPEHTEFVMEEFIEASAARGYLAEGGMRYAREVLERAVGIQRAGEIMNRLSAVIETSPFDYLRATPPDQIAAFLRNEHPQTIALIVAQLPTTALAAKVMEMLPPEVQADVATRIAMMGQTSPDVVREVAQVMESKLETVLQREYAAAGGVRSLASILNSSNRATERNILDHLTDADADLAEEVRRLLFVFEDILKLDDRAIQMVLREVDSKDLALAMRGSTPDVQGKILNNMSSRGAEMLREEMEFMPPQRRRVVEEAQTKIVSVVRKLEDAGEIVIARGGGEDEDDELIG
jgi:flagellar motor switch protein FliG